MKKYMPPKTISIKLDTEQALLQVCAIGGAWFQVAMMCMRSDGSDVGAPQGTSCTMSVRSVSTTPVNSYGFTENMPS